MASLKELLAEEGVEPEELAKTRKPSKRRERVQPDEKILLPAYICHDPKNFISKQKTAKTVCKGGSSAFSSDTIGSVSERSNTKSSATGGSRRDEPAIDQAAIRAVVSILGGFVGRYIKDVNFREALKDKCRSCLVRRRKEPDNGIFANMELGMKSIDKLVDYQGKKKELRMNTLRISIQLLSIVESLNSKRSKKGSTCGTPNSHISACAQLYLAIAYKLEKNDRISARHLLQVFCDSPFLARTQLLPDLWEYFFLPHLLHLKIWHTGELESLSGSKSSKEKKMKALNKVYNDQMDKGTSDFALYYKKWLKVGVDGPLVPAVPLPSKFSNGSSERRSSDSYSTQSSTNKNLYRAVFGSNHVRRFEDFVDQIGASTNIWDSQAKEDSCPDEDSCYVVDKGGGRTSSQNSGELSAQLRTETQKSENFPFLSCQTLPTECLVDGKHRAKNGSVKKEEHAYLNKLSTAIYTVCSSQTLSECETAVRTIINIWLQSDRDPAVEFALSGASVIEGMLEVLFASDDCQIPELVISILAELAVKNEMIRQIILNYDAQLENFVTLLRSNRLFLKTAALLYLLKPKAKQMTSFEWVPLVLRVLEFGDHLQILFTVRCSPRVAAIYFLQQLLTGFDEVKNFENARQVVSQGGLNLLARQIDSGDTQDRKIAAIIMSCCIRAEGSCRTYLSGNLNKDSILELMVYETRKNSSSCAFTLLTQLLCLNRGTQLIEFLGRLKEGWNSLSTTHILLAYLQKAPPEECPLVAAILLQLDLLDDTIETSVYREEAVKALITALDCHTCENKVQEQSARALLMLGGLFCHTGVASIETWLLQQAGFHRTAGTSFQSYEIVINSHFTQSNKDEEETEKWQQKVARVLLDSGNERLLAALSDSIANGIPSLARASIITVTWMARILPSVGDENLQSMACSILMPRLLESLDYDKDVEERVLASYSLMSLLKTTGRVSLLSSWDKESLGKLQNLSQITWTANELASIIISSWRQ